MKALTYLLSLMVALACFSNVMARDRIFGLDWQSTPAQLQANGIALTQQKTKGRLTMYLTHALPINLSDADSYLLIFDRDRGLVKILMVGKDIVADPDGTKGKQRLRELNDILVGKGYTPEPDQSIHRITSKTEDFYACLYKPTCGLWQQVYTKDDVAVLLRLRATRDGTGYIMMSFEEQPQFAQALKQNRQSAMNRDAAAF